MMLRILVLIFAIIAFNPFVQAQTLNRDTIGRQTIFEKKVKHKSSGTSKKKTFVTLAKGHQTKVQPLTDTAKSTDTTRKPRTEISLEALLKQPNKYTIVKTNESFIIDGKPNEDSWAKAVWTEPFSDIEGQQKPVPGASRCKMLWDDDFLYVYAQLNEPHIWAKLKEQDQSIFHDNALEIFIDQKGETHNYIEFQINAFEAVWDLFFSKPYRNGGAQLNGFDIKGLKKRVCINGTLNDPKDKDQYWSVELAFPFKSLQYGNYSKPTAGTIWRMNFSHVQWEIEIKDGIYERKKNTNGRLKSPSYNVWSPQGIINLHYPERWGYVQFRDHSVPDTSFINPEAEGLKRILWKYYYLQQDFKNRYGKYATNLILLREDFPNVEFNKETGLAIIGTDHQYLMQLESKSLKTVFTIDHEGKLVQKAYSKERIIQLSNKNLIIN